MALQSGLERKQERKEKGSGVPNSIFLTGCHVDLQDRKLGINKKGGSVWIRRRAKLSLIQFNLD